MRIRDARLVARSSGWLMARGTAALNGSLTTGAVTQITVRGDATWGAGVFTIANGFTNNGALELLSSGASSAEMVVTTGALTNASGATVRAWGTGGTGALSAPLDNDGTVVVEIPLTLSSSLDQRASLTVAANQTLTVNALTTLLPSSTTTANTGASIVTIGGCSNLGGTVLGWTCTP